MFYCMFYIKFMQTPKRNCFYNLEQLPITGICIILSLPFLFSFLNDSMIVMSKLCFNIQITRLKQSFTFKYLSLKFWLTFDFSSPPLCPDHWWTYCLCHAFPLLPSWLIYCWLITLYLHSRGRHSLSLILFSHFWFLTHVLSCFHIQLCD